MTLLEKANGNISRSEKEKEQMIEAAAHHYGEFLKALGFDWKADHNSENTPKRVAKAWINDIISGCVTTPPVITAFPNDGYDGIVFQGKIPVVSICSHHNLPFTGYAYVAYIPSKEGKVIGLSKLNRIVDFYSRRPQIQEGLTAQIAQHIDSVCEKNQGVAVMIEANHTCCSNRGIKHASTMKTAHLTGFFKEDSACRNEFYHFISDLI
jgi:GTP cyclohydrolase I